MPRTMHFNLLGAPRYFLKGYMLMAIDDNQTFQAWWDQWVVVLDRVRTDRPNSSDSDWSHDDRGPSSPDSTRWISYIM